MQQLRAPPPQLPTPVMPVLCSVASTVKMPLEGSASPAERQDMVTLALAIVEKKVRNLEKRKVSEECCLLISGTAG